VLVWAGRVEASTSVGASASKLSKAVTRLEKRGLVERVACPGAGRAIDVHLTRGGRRESLKATPRHGALARDTLLAALDPDQVMALADLLEPILQRRDREATLGLALVLEP
jgi:DNA-binding MarR family transcriptional regulator